ncbi:MAG: anti-sigma factor family protein [Acidimicrobiales bacterium]
MPEACREQRGRLALAAIGRLPGDERAALDAHLDQCEVCRAELAELVAVGEALAEADPERIKATDRPQPRPALREAVLASLAAERAAARRRRWRLGLAAAAAVVVVIAGVLVGMLRDTGGPVGERVELVGPSGVSAWADLEPKAWGSVIRLEVRGLEPGTVYNLWLRRPDGTRITAGSFTAVRGGTMRVNAAAALPADQASGVGISTRGHTVSYGHLDTGSDDE